MKAVTITVAFTATVPDDVETGYLAVDLDVDRIKLVNHRFNSLSSANCISHLSLEPYLIVETYLDSYVKICLWESPTYTDDDRRER